MENKEKMNTNDIIYLVSLSLGVSINIFMQRQ